MRLKNRAPAVACLDQPKVLRHVLQRLSEDALASRFTHNSYSAVVGIDCRPRVQAGAGASHYSPSADIDNLDPIEHSVFDYGRKNIHMWCEDEERHAVFKTCTWSGALLAAQRFESNAATGEACN